MAKTVTAASFRENMAAEADQIEATHERVTVTRSGRTSFVAVAAADLESMEETIAILSDDAAVAGIASGLADLAAGQVVSGDDFLADWHARHH